MGCQRAVLLLEHLDQQPKGKAAREGRAQLMADLCLYLEACEASRNVTVLLATARPETLSATLLERVPHCLFVPLPSVRTRCPLLPP
jgi:SpoVK/Ycf46/Vps4 family AAA+-type ATPase